MKDSQRYHSNTAASKEESGAARSICWQGKTGCSLTVLLFPFQYNKCQIRSTGMDGQHARFKQRSYPLALDGPVFQQSAQKLRRETCLLGLADRFGNYGRLEKLCKRKVSSIKVYLFITQLSVEFSLQEGIWWG